MILKTFRLQAIRNQIASGRQVASWQVSDLLETIDSLMATVNQITTQSAQAQEPACGSCRQCGSYEEVIERLTVDVGEQTTLARSYKLLYDAYHRTNEALFKEVGRLERELEECEGVLEECDE